MIDEVSTAEVDRQLPVGGALLVDPEWDNHLGLGRRVGGFELEWNEKSGFGPEKLRRKKPSKKT